MSDDQRSPRPGVLPLFRWCWQLAMAVAVLAAVSCAGSADTPAGGEASDASELPFAAADIDEAVDVLADRLGTREAFEAVVDALEEGLTVEQILESADTLAETSTTSPTVQPAASAPEATTSSQAQPRVTVLTDESFRWDLQTAPQGAAQRFRGIVQLESVAGGLSNPAAIDADLVIVFGAAEWDRIVATARRSPAVDFHVIGDAAEMTERTEAPPNISTTTLRWSDAAFLAGTVAARVSATQTVVLSDGSHTPVGDQRNFELGFANGLAAAGGTTVGAVALFDADDSREQFELIDDASSTVASLVDGGAEVLMYPGDVALNVVTRRADDVAVIVREDPALTPVDKSAVLGIITADERTILEEVIATWLADGLTSSGSLGLAEGAVDFVIRNLPSEVDGDALQVELRNVRAGIADGAISTG